MQAGFKLNSPGAREKNRAPRALFWRDRYCLVMLAGSFLANAVLWLWPYFVLKPEQEFIPLHYNIYYGIDAYGRATEIYIIALSGLIIFGANLFLGLVLFKKGRFFSKILMTANLAGQIVLLVALAMILNISVI